MPCGAISGPSGSPTLAPRTQDQWHRGPRTDGTEEPGPTLASVVAISKVPVVSMLEAMMGMPL